MFSFHKPKIYRSNLGCCICKAKSSSSRFTDSKKYENEFEHCFRLKEKRTGEICNACVLLVKRWKKLSPDNRLTKHWHHVVDARAGPGTKLTGNRRLTSPSSSQQRSSSNSSNNGASDHNSKHRFTSRNSDLLPFSSSQSNIQSGSSTKSCRSLSKVCAIDTNVSTFTFGEPIVSVNRTRSYMTNESSYHSSNYSSLAMSATSSSSSTSFKPQSALSSSAFESVIKRFRQRQQQQRLEAERRHMNRQQRLQQRSVQKLKTTESLETSIQRHECDNDSTINKSREYMRPAKRTQRYPSFENMFGVSSVLDSSIWRKEKICCGVIFRGLYDEIAIVPRLLKPCQCRLSGMSDRVNEDSLSGNILDGDSAIINGDDEDEEQLPPPRATKSGSISSCDSNTSGCGSMEDTLNGMTLASDPSVKNGAPRRKTNQADSSRKRSRFDATKKADVRSPSGSSSGNSSSQLAHGDEDDEDDEEVELDAEEDLLSTNSLVLEAGDVSASDSSNDATSSSVESLTTELTGGKEANTVAF